MVLLHESQEGESFSTGYRTTSTPLREPTERDPVVTYLDDKHTQHGGHVALTVEYEAASAVNIMWRRNGINCMPFTRISNPSTGQTSMVIKNATVQQHNNNTYTVVITDKSGRTCSTSARVFVQYYTTNPAW